MANPVESDVLAQISPSQVDTTEFSSVTELSIGSGPFPKSVFVPRVPELPARFGHDDRFELMDCLGSGGSSCVYRVWDRVLNRVIAAKFMLPLDERTYERSLCEARLMARLSHPNIVSVFDTGCVETTPYIAMEFLDGVSLSELLRDAVSLPLPRVVQVLTDIVRALQHAHELGILHGDLKSANIHILCNGQTKVLDFGLCAKLFHDNGVFGTTVSDCSEVMGTPDYMAPEQWTAGTITVQTDFWAAGILFYQLLCGKLPQYRNTPFGLARCGAPEVSLRASTEVLSRAVNRVLRRALAREPEARFRDSAEFLAALRLIELNLDESQELASLQDSERTVAEVVGALGGCFTGHTLERLVELSSRELRAGVDGLLQRGTIGKNTDALVGAYQVRRPDLVKAAFRALPPNARHKLLRKLERLLER